MTISPCLVLLDTDRIHEYIFATNKLREIRGASTILDELNQERTFEILACRGSGNYSNHQNQWKFYDKTIENGLDWEVIFLGGGSGKIRFADRKKANNFCRDLEMLYARKTSRAASMTTAVIPMTDHGNFEDCIYCGEKELRRNKDSKYLRFQPLSNPYFKICQSSGMYPAEKIGQGDRKLICQASYDKRAQQEEDKKGGRFFIKFKQFLENAENTELRQKYKDKWKPLFSQKIQNLLPEDLSDIGTLSNGYIGLIYADGNRMGQRLKHKNTSEAFREFSVKIKNGTENALFQALVHNLRMKLKDQRFPFEILLLGGDDVIIVVPANKAITIARDFCNNFKDKTDVSISAGVIIAHDSYPIHRMIEHAEDLLKSAKRKSNEQPDNEICSVDFMVIKGALLKNLQEVREREFSYNAHEFSGNKTPIKLYERPYNTEELHNLITWIYRFKKCNFPRNKLMTMYESLYRGRWQASLDYLQITSRLEESARNTMVQFWIQYSGGLEVLPWKKEKDELVTPFLDIVELYDFVEKNEESQ